MTTLIPGEQRKTILFDGETLMLIYSSKMLVTNRRGQKQPVLHSLACGPVFGRGRVYQAVVSSILLYGCKTWPVRVADERMLVVFDNDSIHRILRASHRYCVLTMELLQCLMEGFTARRPDGELI